MSVGIKNSEPGSDCSLKNAQAPGLGFWRWVLLVVPALLCLYLIGIYGVDVPWGDQWFGESLLFEKLENHTLGVMDFIHQHNEHRILFPRLIMFGLGVLTHWDVRAESVVIWLLAGCCSASIYCLARARQGGGGMRRLFAQLFAANLLLFTPLQYENMIWGFQIGFLLPIAATIACIWLASSAPYPRNFVYAMLLASICSYSIASGFLAWLLSLPLLIAASKGEKRRGVWWGIFLGAFLIEEALYFIGYEKPMGHPSVLEVFTHPLRAGAYFLAYLGGPFGGGAVFHTLWVAIACGAILLGAFLWCIVVAWRRRKDRALRGKILPWMGLASFALASGAVTTVGRLGFGVKQALCSRYVSFSLYLPLGLLFIVPQLLQGLEAPTASIRRLPRQLFAVVCVILVLIFSLGYIRSFKKWDDYHHQFLTAKALVTTIHIVDEPILVRGYLRRDPVPLKASLQALEKLQDLRPGLLDSKFIREIGDPTSTGDRAFGALQAFGVMSNGLIGAAGWAILPDKQRTADAVLFTRDDENGQPMIFALADIWVANPDAETITGDAAYARSGFSRSFPRDKFPAGKSVIKVWAYDAEDNHAYRIRGEGVVP